jgi:hypothetical protein
MLGRAAKGIHHIGGWSSVRASGVTAPATDPTFRETDTKRLGRGIGARRYWEKHRRARAPDVGFVGLPDFKDRQVAPVFLPHRWPFVVTVRFVGFSAQGVPGKFGRFDARQLRRP